MSVDPKHCPDFVIPVNPPYGLSYETYLARENMRLRKEVERMQAALERALAGAASIRTDSYWRSNLGRTE